MNTFWTNIRTSKAFHWLLDPKHSYVLIGGGILLLALNVWTISRVAPNAAASTQSSSTSEPPSNPAGDEQAKSELKKLGWVKDVYVSPGYMNVGVIRSEKQWDAPMIGTAVCGVLRRCGSGLMRARFVDIEQVTYQQKWLRDAEIFAFDCPPVPSKPEVGQSSSAAATTIETLADFENSEFAKTYRLRKADGWKLNTGAFNNTYETSALSGVSIEVQSVGDKVTSCDFIFDGRTTLRQADLDFAYKLVQSIDTNTAFDPQIKEYIKTNVEKKTAEIKQSKPVMVGNFQIQAGKVGPSQIISIKKR
ncbi:hypothetical protein BH20ACI2_BH20ACI2_16210 [soil metagenome]